MSHWNNIEQGGGVSQPVLARIEALHTVWCNISGEASREIWFWSLLEVKGLSGVFLSLKGDDGRILYPGDHDQSFAYLCVDIYKRHVYVWYHCWSWPAASRLYPSKLASVVRPWFVRGSSVMVAVLYHCPSNSRGFTEKELWEEAGRQPMTLETVACHFQCGYLHMPACTANV